MHVAVQMEFKADRREPLGDMLRRIAAQFEQAGLELTTGATFSDGMVASKTSAIDRALKKYPHLEAMLAGGQFPQQAEALRLYRRIATMVTTAPLPAVIPDATPTWGKAAILADDWGLNALAERLHGMAGSDPGSGKQEE